MDKEHLKKIIHESIDKSKWKDIIARFIDVLKINIFLINSKGQVILPPMKDRYGWTFFEKTCLGLGSSRRKAELLTKFKKNGNYLEYKCASGFQSFAIPIRVELEDPIAYLIVGPVILNRRKEQSVYKEFAKNAGISFSDFMNEVNKVRVVSHLTIKSILDLLAEVARDVTELNFEKKKLSQVRINQEALPKQLTEVAQDIYATIHQDELLVTLLDVALKMTNTECGSIMIVDPETGDLIIKASRGINDEKIQSRRLKIGEGIAGVAAQENSPFIIHGTQGENRIQTYLKRPEIKEAIVMPLSTKDRVFGVLNLHTKKDANALDESMDNLQYLSKLIAAAFQSI